MNKPLTWSSLFLAKKVLLVLPLLSGCVFLPVESQDVPCPDPAVEAAISGYREAVGVIHVHSVYSDGTGTVEQIAAIAEQQGLDFLILTDHNTLRAKQEGKEGFHGKTLLLVGSEISSEGHYLAFRIKEDVPQGKKFQPTSDAVTAGGGLGFIAHPLWHKKRWEHWGLHGFTGMEIYNAAQDATEENSVSLILWTLLTGSDVSASRWLDRPDRTLELWDRYLADRGPVVGIGGADAHGLKRVGLRLGPYETLFKLVRNHLLISGELTEAAVYDALGKGRLFVAHDILADARGFRFTAVKEDKVLGTMGEKVRWEPGLRLRANLPGPGEMTLFLDGRPVEKRRGREAAFDVKGKGIYRLEVTRKGLPWIYTNPIYVTE
ncbi:MAG: CehA/McbA family metallohydrolase [Candidatus Omnitrophota bacterium]|nr:CehA/McbA family metallohydrolase [Candidatus Omnitrophota bacterium]